MPLQKIVPSILMLILAAVACKNEGKSATDKPLDNGTAIISFSETEHHFGRIIEGEKVACVFNFENKGDGDLIISSATATCGCTVPRFDNKPIKPGGKGTIEVVFDSSRREGVQSKTITVRSNASVKVVVLRIVAEVITNK